MYATFHPPRRKRAILYHLLAIGSLLLPQVTCQFVFPYPPLPTDIFTTRAQCRAYYNTCMDAFRDCLSAAGSNNSNQKNCEDWKNNTCENTIRMGCDRLPNDKQVVAGGTLSGGGALGTGMTSSGGSFSAPTSSNTRTFKSASTVSPSFPSPPFSQSVSPRPTQASDTTSPIPTVPTSTSTQAFPSPTTPPIISPTFFSSFTTAVITSTITATQTFTTGASTWTATMTRTTITTQRRGLNFTGIPNDSARPWCRTGIGIGFLFFWSVVGWAGCLV